jgi:hypothetical protein
MNDEQAAGRIVTFVARPSEPGAGADTAEGPRPRAAKATITTLPLSRATLRARLALLRPKAIKALPARVQR